MSRLRHQFAIHMTGYETKITRRWPRIHLGSGCAVLTFWGNLVLAGAARQAVDVVHAVVVSRRGGEQH